MSEQKVSDAADLLAMLDRKVDDGKVEVDDSFFDENELDEFDFDDWEGDF
jgi:hypothetical protein